jgi:hypothetical protein
MYYRFRDVVYVIRRCCHANRWRGVMLEIGIAAMSAVFVAQLVFGNPEQPGHKTTFARVKVADATHGNHPALLYDVFGEG